MDSSGRENGKADKQPANPIEQVNIKPDHVFIEDHLPSLPPRWTHPVDKSVYTLQLVRAEGLTSAQLNECFQLILHTSGTDYRCSSTGWHPSAKKKEMRSPELRYILVRREGEIRGFTSLMPTWENGEAVVYCYEIHLRDELLRTGLGKLLMGYVGLVAERIDVVEKVMLTCFVRNRRARAFYEALGFGVDESSPRERRLRGKVVVPDYVILSRRVRGRRRMEGGADGEADDDDTGGGGESDGEADDDDDDDIGGGGEGDGEADDDDDIGGGGEGDGEADDDDIGGGGEGDR